MLGATLAIGVGACRPAAKARADESLTVASPKGDRSEVAATAAPADVDGCTDIDSRTTERIQLPSNGSVSVASGLRVHFVGVSEDLYDDGGFDLLADIRLQWGDVADGAVVSTLTPPKFRKALGHCWRVTKADADGASIEVALASDIAMTHLPSCREAGLPEAGLEPLSSFGQADVGARFAVTLRYESDRHEWLVSPAPRILPHHASRLTWNALAAWGHQGLGAARERDVLATIRVIDKEIKAVPGRRQWRGSYVAVIEAACLP